MKVNPVTDYWIKPPSSLSSVPAEADSRFAHTLNDALSKNKERDQLKAACRELESVFLAKVFDSMQATITRGDFFGRSFASDLFESMLYDEYAQEISKTSSLGIAELLYKQLSSA